MAASARPMEQKMKQTKATKEYFALKTISEKLNFDTFGRPGAKDIQQDQDRLKDKRRSFLEKAWKNLASNNHASHVPHITRRRRYLAKMEAEAYTENDIREGSPRAMLGLADNAEEALFVLQQTDFKWIGAWAMTYREHVTVDWNFYSKRHHAKYGPKKTTDRLCTFAKMHRGKVKTIVVPVKAGVEAQIINAAIEHGIIKAECKSKHPMALRLKKCFDAKKIKTIDGVVVYSRTLDGRHYDYAAHDQAANVYYHDITIDRVLTGLAQKIEASNEAAALQGEAVVTYDLCRSLGFCETGIGEFCSELGLDINGRYTPEDIKKTVLINPELAAPFRAELYTLARHFNMKIPRLA